MTDPVPVTSSPSVRRDPVVQARHAPITPASIYPSVPSDYMELTNGERRHLRILSDSERPEATAAIREMSARGTALQRELGDLVAPADALADVAKRLQVAGESLVVARANVRFLEDALAVAQNDAVLMLEDAHREFEIRRDRNAALAIQYTALQSFFRNRKNAVVQGKAKARKVRERSNA